MHEAYQFALLLLLLPNQVLDQVQLQAQTTVALPTTSQPYKSTRLLFSSYSHLLSIIVFLKSHYQRYISEL